MSKIKFPLAGSPSSRLADLDLDQRFVNCFPEVVQNPITGDSKIYLMKRDGLEFESTPATLAEGRGIYGWNGHIYSVSGNKVYEDNVAIQTLTTSTGYVGMIEWSMANDYLVILDGLKGYYINTSGTVTEITDAQFPTPHIPRPVYMDGTLYVQKTTGEIFNSDTADLTAWDASSYITPESYPVLPVSLARQNNLLAALGSTSVEFFYNAGNPAPGSPLGRNTQAILQYGCASNDSVVDEEGLIIFVAQSQTGGKFVVAVEGTKDTNISTEAVNRALYAEGVNIVDCWAYLTRMKGHLMYVLNLPLSSRTFVYDLQAKMWHEWEYYDGTTDGIFPLADVTEFDDQQYGVHVGNGRVYRFSPDQYRDQALLVGEVSTNYNIKVLIQTMRLDMDTGNVKFMDRLEVLGDWPTVSATMNIYWSDNDYQTWSAARPVDLSQRSYIYRCGSFRRRAFRLYTEANAPIRLQSLEVEIRGGEH